MLIQLTIFRTKKKTFMQNFHSISLQSVCSFPFLNYKQTIVTTYLSGLGICNVKCENTMNFKNQQSVFNK